MDSFIKLSNFGKIAPYAQLFRQGLLVTVLLSLFTVVIGFVLALILALMRMSNVRPFRFLAVTEMVISVRVGLLYGSPNLIRFHLLRQLM